MVSSPSKKLRFLKFSSLKFLYLPVTEKRTNREFIRKLFEPKSLFRFPVNLIKTISISLRYIVAGGSTMQCQKNELHIKGKRALGQKKSVINNV